MWLNTRQYTGNMQHNILKLWNLATAKIEKASEKDATRNTRQCP